MKQAIAKGTLAIAIAVGVLAVYVWWYPWVFSLLWPSTGLARLGLSHTWVATAILLAGSLLWLALSARKRTNLRIISISTLVSSAYAGSSYAWVMTQPIPWPAASPYVDAPAEIVDYLQSFRMGYLEAVMGHGRTYCFSPEAETRGFYEGQVAGLKVWYRTFGIPFKNADREIIEQSALRDGVSIEAKN